MIGYKLAKLLLSVAGMATGALLLLSVAPIAFGGLEVTMNQDLNLDYNPVDGTLTVDAGITISSIMPWDINIDYEIILGTPDNPALTIPGSTNIPSGGSGTIDVHFEANAGDLLTYLLTSMDTSFQSNDEDGTFSGHFSLPLTVNIAGDYVQSLVGFDVGVIFDLGGDAEGKLEKDAGGTFLAGEVFFNPGVDLPIDATFNVTFRIETDDLRSINGTMSYTNMPLPGNPNLELNIVTDPSITPIESILTYAYGHMSTTKVFVDGAEVTIDQEKMDMMLGAIGSMLNHAGVV